MKKLNDVSREFKRKLNAIRLNSLQVDMTHLRKSIVKQFIEDYERLLKAQDATDSHPTTGSSENAVDIIDRDDEHIRKLRKKYHPEYKGPISYTICRTKKDGKHVKTTLIS